MSYAKLNVWVRDAKCCRVINRQAHLHVYNCCGEEVKVDNSEIYDGHTEVQIPPGCYIVVAGVREIHNSNMYTERAMVIVRCGEEACVNLILGGKAYSESEVDSKK